MSKIDFANEKEYYRNILEEYSPAELSYIDNFKIKPMRVIVAILLKLKLKGKIEINKNKIVVINSETEGLKKTERFIINNIKSGKLKLGNWFYIKLFAEEESIEDGLLIKKTIADNKKSKSIMLIKGLMLLMIVITILMLFLLQTIEILVSVLNSLMIFSYFFGIAYIILNSDYKYKRTKKGEELNKKIEGIKKYIKDYSLLDDKSKNELIIWKEYLIYSVVFGLNDRIEQEMANLIELEENYSQNML